MRKPVYIIVPIDHSTNAAGEWTLSQLLHMAVVDHCIEAAVALYRDYDIDLSPLFDITN